MNQWYHDSQCGSVLPASGAFYPSRKLEDPLPDRVLGLARINLLGEDVELDVVLRAELLVREVGK